jgi:hypothetical protein
MTEPETINIHDTGDLVDRGANGDIAIHDTGDLVDRGANGDIAIHDSGDLVDRGANGDTAGKRPKVMPTNWCASINTRASEKVEVTSSGGLQTEYVELKSPLPEHLRYILDEDLIGHAFCLDKEDIDKKRRSSILKIYNDHVEKGWKHHGSSTRRGQKKYSSMLKGTGPTSYHIGTKFNFACLIQRQPNVGTDNNHDANEALLYSNKRMTRKRTRYRQRRHRQRPQ